MTMSDNSDDELINQAIKRILDKVTEEEGITNHSIETNLGTAKGDNYLGVIVNIKITGARNGKEVTLDLVTKLAPKSEGLRSFAPIDVAYDREIYIYTQFLPMIKTFQEKRAITNPLKCFAKCFATLGEDMNEALIMENMKTLGYKMQNRKKPLDYSHSKLVLNELAKLHAISFAIKDQEPETYRKILNDMKCDFFDGMNKEYSKDMFRKRCDELIHYFDPEQHKDALKKFKEISNTLSAKMYELFTTKAAEQYGVVCHGDSWINNILFRYENPQKPEIPTKLCLLDWQISHIGSPILDVFYFLYSSTDQTLRNEHYVKLIQGYYDSFNKFLEELGSKPEDLFPENVFREHVNKFAIFGVCTAIILVPLIVSDSEDIPDINSALDAGTNAAEVLSFSLKDNKLSNERVRDVFLHAFNNGFT